MKDFTNVLTQKEIEIIEDIIEEKIDEYTASSVIIDYNRNGSEIYVGFHSIKRKSFIETLVRLIAEKMNFNFVDFTEYKSTNYWEITYKKL